MSPEDQDRMWGMLTGINALLEHTWAMLSSFGEDEVATARRFRDKILREFDLPPEDEPHEGRYAASQYAVSYLEEFFDKVERRVTDLPEG